jgi:hypothetical protein
MSLRQLKPALLSRSSRCVRSVERVRGRALSFLGSLPLLQVLLGGPCFALDPDPEIPALIETITAESLLAHVDRLVSFAPRRAGEQGGTAAQEYIQAFLSGLMLDEVYLQDFDQGLDNVVGILRGASNPDRMHVIGAHYDTAGPSPGADDNASGTAAVLEAARAIAQTGCRPAETIVFVAFAAEESGLAGSKAFVAALGDRKDDVADMICLDVIGYLEPGTRLDLSVSSNSFTPEINALIDVLGDVAATYLPTWPFEGGPGCG